MNLTVTFELRILYLVAANIIAILVWALLVKRRSRMKDANLGRVTAAIKEYFKRSGNLVRVECVPRAGATRFIATIDSQPRRRFRHSHIIELGLRMYVLKTCGLELERVYWRFIVDADGESHDAPYDDHDGSLDDDYLNEDDLLATARAEYVVNEISWEHYQKHARQTQMLNHGQPRDSLEAETSAGRASTERTG